MLHNKMYIINILFCNKLHLLNTKNSWYGIPNIWFIIVVHLVINNNIAENGFQILTSCPLSNGLCPGLFKIRQVYFIHSVRILYLLL